MNNEFKKLSQGNITRYVLENATGMGSGSVASMPMSIGGMQRRKGDNLIAQEADKKSVPASTPRNFVAKNAKTAGAGAHKDKSKTIPRKEKHKKPYMEALQAQLDQLKSKVEENTQLGELSIDTLRSYVPKRLNKAKDQISADPAKRNIEKAKKATTQDVPRAMTRLKDPAYGKQGAAEGFNGEYDDEAGMAQSNLLTTARAVMGLLKTIKDRDNLPEWGQEKIAKAEMMLVSVWDYLQSQKAMGNDPQQGVAEGKKENKHDLIPVKLLKRNVPYWLTYDFYGHGGEMVKLSGPHPTNNNYIIVKDQDGNKYNVSKNAVLFTSDPTQNKGDHQGVAEGDYADGSSIKTPGSEDWKQQYQQAVMAVKNAKTQQEYEAASDRAGRIKDLLASKGIQVGAVLGQQGVAEGSPKDPNAPKLVQDRKTGKWYDPNKEFEKKMTSPEVKAQMKRMAQKEGVAGGSEENIDQFISGNSPNFNGESNRVSADTAQYNFINFLEKKGFNVDYINDQAYPVLVAICQGKMCAWYDFKNAHGYVSEQSVAEGDAGLSKDAETNFHAKLDQLVHATFGKRKSEQGMEEGSWDDIKKFGKKAAVAGAIGLGIGAANASGWSPSDVPAGGHNQLPDIVAHVKFKVGDKEISKEINLGSHYRSPGEAGKELENFLKSKGIKFYEYSLERVKPKANDKIDNSPATSDMKGSMDTSEPAATGPSTDNYMAKDNDPERGPSMGGKFVKEGAKVDRQAKHITASMMKKGKSKKDAESIAWAHIKHPKSESVDSYIESLDVMLERQLEPTMDLDAWNNNFQNADPQKYHQFKNKTPEKKK